MVNFRDPAVIAQDARAYSSVAILQHPTNYSFISGDDQAVAHRERSLHVSSSRRISGTCHGASFNPILTPSWEFVTTLNYEWDVIRGRHPYRRTIWVRTPPCFPVLGTHESPRTDLVVQYLIDLFRGATGRPFVRNTWSRPPG